MKNVRERIKELESLVRSWARLEIKSFDDKTRTFEGIATTPNTDRMDDVVEPKGAEFTLPISFLKGHRSDTPIGLITEVKVKSDGIHVKGYVENVDAPPTLKERLDVTWTEMKLKLIRGLSIGFRPLKMEPVNENDPYGGIRFLKWEWLELSAVVIPANADATITSIKSYDKQSSSAASGEVTKSAVVHLESPGASGSVVSYKRKGAEMKRTVAEQIAAYEAKRQANLARMSAIMDMAEEDGDRTLETAEAEEYDNLKGEVAEIDKHLTRLREHQKTLLENAEEIDPEKFGGGGPTREDNKGEVRHGEGVLRPNKNLPKGMAFVRYTMLLARAKGNHMQALQWARQFRDSTPEVEKAFQAIVDGGVVTQKAAVAAGTTTDATWAGPLVQLQPLAAEFIEFLRPMTIIGRIPNFRMVPFNISIPRQTAGSSSKWVGQSAPKPLSKQGYDLVQMKFAKISTIVVLSEELVRYSTPSAEALARQDMANAIAQYMDEQAFNPDVAAVANVSPAAITNGATKVNSTGTTISAVDTDVGAVFSVLTTNNVSLLGGVWVMNPRTAQAIGMLRTANGPLAYPDIGANGGTFWGFPVLTSNNISISSVSANETFAVFFNPTEVLLADDGAMTIDMSTEASLEMDSAPAGGAVSLLSLFQNNLVALRAERYINWLPRRTKAVAIWDGLRL